jgi:uncharacterized protein (TIGR03382 family)
VALALNSIGVSGASSVTIASQTCGTTLAVGANCTVTLSFLPTTAGAAAATLAVTSNAAPLQVTIAGTGTTAPVAQPALSEAGPVAFADTQVGKSAAVHTITLSNNGTAAMKISSLVLDGAQAADFVLGGTCAANASVAAAASCTIDVGFKPTAAGQRAATMMLMTDAGSQFTVALNGTGVAVPVPMLTTNPQSFDFGAADVNGTAPTHRITLTNTGANAATVTAATFTGPFALQSDATGCAAVPFTLQPGASCDVVVRFAPIGAGDASGSLALAADGGGAWTVALTGKGNVQTGQTMQNAGGGGCSAATSGNDPVLALLVVLSFGVLGWRRFVRKEVTK